ncbi:MAG: hypothetical protein FJ118_11560 [Deltaproteobacteria bacterium]|nr:hypothetical protein [Deltaproteobacteria bacterium]
MLGQRKQTCVDCHFFEKIAALVEHGENTLVVKESERNKALSGDYFWQLDMYVLACHFNVWREDPGYDLPRKQDVVIQVERHDQCFFWRHHPGMLLPAAAILQEREAKARETGRDRRLTICGLWIAALALLAQVLLKIAEALKWWPVR